MSAIQRIPIEERAAYLRFEITSRELSARYNIPIGYLYQILPRPPRPKKPKKSELNAARRAFRTQLASTTPTLEAARIAHCSTRTIFRYKAKARNGA